MLIGGEADVSFEARRGEEIFLRGLFDALHRVRCSYAVMRNYDTLPITTGGSDLDLLVSPRDACGALDQLFQVVESSGAAIVGQSRSSGFRKIFVMGRGRRGEWWGLRVDVNIGLAYKGAQLLEEDFSSSVALRRGVAVLHSGLSSALGVLKEVLNNGHVPARYLGTARAAAVGGEWDRLRQLFAPMGNPAIDRLQRVLCDSAPGPCLKEAGLLRGDLTRHAVRRQLISYARDRSRFEASKLRRYLFPSGAVIAVLGVDGVGKSTVIDGIYPVLSEATHGACKVQHLRPGLLPPLSRLKGARASPAGPVVDPHGSEPAGMLGSLARIAWLLADYALGYWLRVRPFVAKQPGIVVFDRYAYDMALDPRRFRIGLPPRMVSWLSSLAPKPDLVICLHASPATIMARKQELPESEIRRQVDALHALAARDPRAVLVSTDGRVEEVRDRVLQALHQFFMRRGRATRTGLAAE